MVEKAQANGITAWRHNLDARSRFGDLTALAGQKFRGMKIDHSCDLRLGGEVQYRFVNTGMEIIELDDKQQRRNDH